MCVERLIAPATRPPRARTGRGDGDEPFLELLVDDRVARGADLVQLVAQLVGVGHRSRQVGLQRGACQVGLELVVRQAGEQHLAHRGRVRGHPAADVDRQGHHGRRGDADDVDDVLAVEHGCLAGLVDLRHEALQVRERDVGEAKAGEEAVAELQDAGRQPERAAVGLDVAELDQRDQEAPRGRAGQPGGDRQLGDRLDRRVRAERADDVQPALQRLDELARPSGNDLFVEL